MSKWSIAQQGELNWHKDNPWREDDWAFIINTHSLFDKFGFSRESFIGKTVLDVGAGPRLRTKYFKGIDLYTIEPLGDKFINEFSWCDLEDSKLYVNSVEKFIPELSNKFDFIISINVLDHCSDFISSINNMYAYLKKGGELFVSYDLHDGDDPLHPLSLTKAFSEEVFNTLNLSIYNIIEYTPYGRGDLSISYRINKK